MQGSVKMQTNITAQQLLAKTAKSVTLVIIYSCCFHHRSPRLIRPDQRVTVSTSMFLAIQTTTKPQSFETKMGPAGFPKVSVLGAQRLSSVGRQKCSKSDAF